MTSIAQNRESDQRCARTHSVYLAQFFWAGLEDSIERNKEIDQTVCRDHDFKALRFYQVKHVAGSFDEGDTCNRQ